MNRYGLPIALLALLVKCGSTSSDSGTSSGGASTGGSGAVGGTIGSDSSSGGFAGIGGAASADSSTGDEGSQTWSCHITEGAGGFWGTCICQPGSGGEVPSCNVSLFSPCYLKPCGAVTCCTCGGEVPLEATALVDACPPP